MMVLEPAGEYEEEYEESAVSQVVKYILFFLNFLFWVAGLGLMALGAWAIATKELEKLKVATSAFDYLFDLTVIMMIFGLLVCIISTAGCVGALRENLCLLKTFVGFLCLSLLVLLASGLTLIILNGPLLRSLENSISAKWLKNYHDDPDLEDLTNWVQEEFECCGMGADGYEEWGAYNAYFLCRPSNPDPRACSVPSSCCRPEYRLSEDGLPDPWCGADVLKEARPANAERIFVRGCVGALNDSIRRNVYTIAGASLALAAIPLFQLLLAIVLIRQIQAQMDKWGRGRRRMGPVRGNRSSPYQPPFHARHLGRRAFL